MNILGTGLSGLVGTRIVSLLSDEFSFQNLSLETGVDITDATRVERIIQASDAPWVFHFAARTDVDGAEKERRLGAAGATWKVNVLATENIAAACQKTGKHLLYISTDYVFAGTKDAYTEQDEPRPQGWYAQTKYEGEKRVQLLGDHALIIRISNPYCAKPTGKIDFVHKIAQVLGAGQAITAPDDQMFIPTFIDDIAAAIRVLVQKQSSGVYHVVGSQALSPFAAAVRIARAFGLDARLVSPITFVAYFAGRAPRPFRAVLKNDKITKLGVVMSTFDEGLHTIASRTDI